MDFPRRSVALVKASVEYWTCFGCSAASKSGKCIGSLILTGHPVQRCSLAFCIRRPVQGAKKDGVKGFVKGVGSGIMSGVVKGVSGITEPGCSFVIVIAA